MTDMFEILFTVTIITLIFSVPNIRLGKADTCLFIIILGIGGLSRQIEILVRR